MTTLRVSSMPLFQGNSRRSAANDFNSVRSVLCRYLSLISHSQNDGRYGRRAKRRVFMAAHIVPLFGTFMLQFSGIGISNIFTYGHNDSEGCARHALTP